MRRSFLRLVVTSVVVFWAIGFLLLFTYIRTLSWDEARAQRDGVFLVHEMLAEVPHARRGERLDALRTHFSIPLGLVTSDEMARRLGRLPAPGERVTYTPSNREAWWFQAFADGQGGLAAGPVDPTRPQGFFPVGILFALVGLPLLGAIIAVRLERQVRKVERASAALAVDDLAARVDNTDGPSSELAASFNAMAERVERLIRGRDELVQAVSHELGSPLSRLRFHMELLESGAEDTRAERMDAIARELDALEALVEELLGYVQSDELSLDRTAFDPSRDLADLAELARLEAPEDAEIDVEVALPEGAVVFADARLFQRAVENILRNAMQHARGRVRLEVTPDGAAVRVAVHDDGPGIPEPLRAQVLTPFYRVEADRGRRTGGVGLGLAIVSRIVERHGARLAIARSPLGGASVAITWPTAQSAAAG